MLNLWTLLFVILGKIFIDVFLFVVGHSLIVCCPHPLRRLSRNRLFLFVLLCNHDGYIIQPFSQDNCSVFFFFYTKCSHCYYLSPIFFILRPRIFFSLAWSTFFTIISAIELVTLFNNILIFEAFYKSIPFCNDLILKSHEYFIRFKIFPSENAGV